MPDDKHNPCFVQVKNLTTPCVEILDTCLTPDDVDYNVSPKQQRLQQLQNHKYPVPDDVDNSKAWQNSDNWEREFPSGQCIYHGPPPPPRCIADRMVECADGSRYDPATGMSWPSRSGYTIPDDVDTSGGQLVWNDPVSHFIRVNEICANVVRDNLRRKLPWYVRLWRRVRGWFKR